MAAASPSGSAACSCHETLKHNPMGSDENQDAWDGRVRHFETRLNEVVTSTERTERRVGEQIRENSAAIAEVRTETTQTRQQIAELRTESRQQITELRTETKQQIAELRTEVRGQMDEMLVVLRTLAAQRA